MNAPEPENSPDQAELAVTGMGISLLLVMISGPIALFAPWRTQFFLSCLAWFVLLWSLTMLITQYMASIRRDVFASRVICIQWNCLTVSAVGILLWYLVSSTQSYGFDLSKLGFTFMGLIVLVIGCSIFAVGNWKWRQQLLQAQRNGMQTTPWSQLSIVDLMAATLVTAIVMGAFSFLFRN